MLGRSPKTEYTYQPSHHLKSFSVQNLYAVRNASELSVAVFAESTNGL